MDKTTQAILGLTDNEVYAEEALMFIYRKYQLHGSNELIVRMFNNWLNFICDNFDDDMVFCFGVMAVKDLKIDFPLQVNKHVHDKLSPIINRHFDKLYPKKNIKEFSYDDYPNRETMGDRWAEDEFGIKLREDEQ